MKTIIIDPYSGFPLMKIIIKQASNKNSNDFREFGNNTTTGIAGILKSTKNKIQKDDINVFAIGGNFVDDTTENFVDDINEDIDDITIDNINLVKTEYSDSDDDIFVQICQDID
jgi:hypothetical protein